MAVKFDPASGTFVADHNLDAGDITRGVLDVARGGTGADGSTLAAHLVLAGPATGGPGPATYRSLVAEDLPATAVTAGTYGDATHVARLVVDAQGRITSVTEVSISAGSSFDPASPGPIGGTTPAAGTFTTLTATSVLAPLLDRASAGTLTLGGTATTLQLAAGVSLSGAAGAGALSLGSLSGAWTMPTGNGSWTGASNATLTLTSSGASGAITIRATSATLSLRSDNVRIQSSAGSDALWITGTNAVMVYAGTFGTPAANVLFDWSSSTGNFLFPTGAMTYTGASGSAVSLTAAGATGTMLLKTTGSGATLTVQTTGTSAYVLLDGTTGIVVRRSTANFADFGNTASTALTLAAGISLSGASGTGGLSLGSMTGNTALPKGDLSWTATANKNLALYASGTGTVDIQSGGATYLLSGGLLRASGTSVELTAASTTVTVEGQTGTVFTRNTTALLDVGSTSSTAVTVRSGARLALDSGTATGAAGAATLSKQVGVITTESLSTAAGSRQTYTITNSLVSASSRIMCFLMGGTNTTRPVYLTNAVPGSGSFTVDIENGGSGALNGTIVFMFLVL